MHGETSRTFVDSSSPQSPVIVVVHVLHAVSVLGEGVRTAGVGPPIGSGLHLGAQPLHHGQHPPRASLSITYTHTQHLLALALPNSAEKVQRGDHRNAQPEEN